MFERIDIERALDDLISNEEGMRFQGLAVALARLRWPELLACERHNDRGLDAYATASTAPNGIGKGLACSITATLAKLSGDAGTAKEHYGPFSVLIFATPRKVTKETQEQWAYKIQTEYGYELVVISRAEIIASLQVPDNAWMYKVHLRIPVPYAVPLNETLYAIRDAACDEASRWAAHPRLNDKPRIALNAIKLDSHGEDTQEIFSSTRREPWLTPGQRIVIEAPAGRGKTTTLIQLAQSYISLEVIPILVDLPAWVRSGTGIVEYIARIPSFLARDIRTPVLVRAFQEGCCSFLLNGWNEISSIHYEQASGMLRTLARDYPGAGIIVASRPHHIVPTLPGGTRFRLLPLTPMQRRRYLAEALGEGPAAELGLALSRDPVLNDLTRTPFILAEVTALFRARIPIPRTKLGLLEAVVGLVERSEEHAGQLQGPPLRGLSEQYLRAVALYLTTRGNVLLADSDARPICRAVSEALRITGQISAPPEPDDVLNALTSHHILERVEYPNTSFRFEHQQFQEYYCALMLRDEFAIMVASEDPAQAEGFASKYVNDPSWEEPLRMIAAESSGTRTGIATGAALVRLALRVDAVLAARFSHLSGPAVWAETRSDVHHRLRALYGAPNHQLREYALVAMLATGSDEFTDIVIPLLTNSDQQVRLCTYRSGMPFHPSSLGPDWQRIVATWTEGLRAEFASELTMHQGMIEVGLFFARSDPSLAVRLAALHGLSWMGQYDEVAEILYALSDPEFEQVVAKFDWEEIPQALYPRAIAAYKTLLDRTDACKARLQIALALAELNDADTPARLKAELNTLPLDLVRELSDYLLRSAIDILRIVDPQWVSDWVTDRIIQGGLWRDSWLSLILPIPQSLKDQLLQQVCTEDLRRGGGGGAVTILRATADADTARAVFIAYRDHHRVLLADPQSQEEQVIDSQLRGLLRSIPRAILIDGLSDILAQPPESEGLAIITELFVLRGADNDEANDVLPEPQRNRLRTYLKSAVRFMLEQDDFSGQGKGYLSSALARVGERNDMADIVEMIRADIIRMREGRAARARDHRLRRARASSASWTIWHMEALVWLGRAGSEPFLTELLNEPEYEVDAAWALQVLARKTHPGPNVIMSARLGNTARDYRKVRSGASEWRAIYAEDLRLKYTAAVRQGILNLLEQSQAGDHKTTPYHHRLKELAKALAALDPQDSADLILDIAELPTRSDGWVRLALLEALVFAGVSIPESRMTAMLGPVLAEFRAHGIYNNAGLLTRLLCLLPFVDEPKRGIVRIREILAEFRVSWYDNRDLLFALAQCADNSGLELVRDVRDVSGGAFQHVAKDWLEGLASCPLPGARDMLPEFLDSDPGTPERTLPDYAVTALAAQLAKLARADTSIAERILARSTESVSVQQRVILEKVLVWLGTPASLLAGLNLIDDVSPQPIPYEIFRAVEDVFLEKRPHGSNSQSYVCVPRAANDIKTRLFEMARRDSQRSKSAYSLLVQIENWRLEYGRPPSEPRHPAIDSGEAWPPMPPSSVPAQDGTFD